MLRILLNIIWLVFAGIWATILSFGREVVPIEQARSMERDAQNIDFGSL